MAAFKDSQKGGAGSYTSNMVVACGIRTNDPAADPKAKPRELTKPQGIAQDIDVEDGCSAPIVSSAGGYKPVIRGGGRRYEPL